MPSADLIYVIALKLQHVWTAKGHFHGSGVSYMKGTVFSFNCVFELRSQIKNFVNLYYLLYEKHVLPLLKPIFHVLRRESTVQFDSTIQQYNPQSLTFLTLYFILFWFVYTRYLKKATCNISNFKTHTPILNTITTVPIYIYIFIPSAFKMTLRYRNMLQH